MFLRFVSIVPMLLVVSAGLALNENANAGGHTIADPIVKRKLGEERACMIRFTNKAKASCLDGLAEWWWSESVNYNLGSYDPISEIHRILTQSTRLDPSDLDRFTNFLWMQFSVDVNRVQDGKAKDVTFAARDKVKEFSRFHHGQFAYPFLTVDQMILFTLPRGVGSKGMKLAYLDFAQALQTQAKELYPLIKDRLPASERERVEFQLGATDRVLLRRRAQLEALP